MSHKSWQMLAAIVAAIVIAFWYVGSQSEPITRPHFPRTNLVITRADGAQFFFTAEIATTRAEQAYGLMFLRSLPEDEGMIFPFAPPQEVAFWMKNTLIPLDMLFIRPDGTIGTIAANAKPQDVTPIPSEVPVIAVIEINGGLAQKDNLAVGDKVESAAIKTQ